MKYSYKHLYLIGGAEHSRLWFYTDFKGETEDMLKDGFFHENKADLYEGNVIYLMGKKKETLIQQIYYNEEDIVCLRNINTRKEIT